MQHRKLGFTTVEVLVIAPIVMLVLAVFVVAIVSMVGDVLASRKQNALTYDIQDALNRIDQDVRVSGGYLSTTNITLTSPQGVDDGTLIFKNVDQTYGTALVLNSYATTGNPQGSASDRNAVYLSNSPNACGSGSVNQNNKMMTNIVYFIRNNALWRRVITRSDYLTGGCSTPWQKPSCTPGYSAAFCKTEDQKLVDGVAASDFTISYYPNPSSTTPDPIASNVGSTDTDRQTALRSNDTALVTITVKLTVSGQDITQSESIKVVSPNDNS